MPTLTVFVKELARQTFAVSRAGLVFGTGVAMLALVFAGSREPAVIGGYTAGYFVLLGVILPITLATGVANERRAGAEAAFSSPLHAYLTLGLVGVLAGVLGGLFFVVIATNLLAIFGRIEVQALSAAIVAGVGSTSFTLVTLATAVSGLTIAVWYHQHPV